MSKISIGAVIGLAVLSGCGQSPGVSQPTESFTQSPAAMNVDRNRVRTEIAAGFERRDYRAAIAAMDDWRQRHPGDFEMQEIRPLAFALAGDTAGWSQARAQLLQDWARQRGTVPPPPGAGFTIDVFAYGPNRIVATQCLERAGRFGVLYKLAVMVPSGQMQSFFTVESSDTDNRVARDLGQPGNIVTLDHNLPGRHETVAMMHGVPPYNVIRQRVQAYLDDPHPASASTTGNPALANYGCEVSRGR